MAKNMKSLKKSEQGSESPSGKGLAAIGGVLNFKRKIKGAVEKNGPKPINKNLTLKLGKALGAK
jgi:hypothetical protein